MHIPDTKLLAGYVIVKKNKPLHETYVHEFYIGAKHSKHYLKQFNLMVR